MPFPVFLAGSLVVNYPYDDNEQGVATYSKSPDDAVFQQIALSYSKVHWKVNSVKTTLKHLGQMLSLVAKTLWAPYFFSPPVSHLTSEHYSSFSISS